MAAVKSDNPLHAEINKNFNIIVFEFCPDLEDYKYCGINSANEVSTYIGDEKLKIKLFNEVLKGRADRYTKKIRKRLILNFYSK